MIRFKHFDWDVIITYPDREIHIYLNDKEHTKEALTEMYTRDNPLGNVFVMEHFNMPDLHCSEHMLKGHSFD